MNLHEVIEEARLQYRAYTRENSRVQLPEHTKTVDTRNFVRPSGFGCPEKHAYQKFNFPYGIPDLDPNNNIGLADLLDQGTYIAEMYQEALYWWASQRDDVECDIELPLIDEEAKISGQADAILRFPNETWVIEFKFTMEKSTEHGPGDPKLSHAMQTMCYMGIANRSTPERPVKGYMVTIGKGSSSKPAYACWELVPRGSGYIIHNTANELPLQVYIGDDWNNPEVLNHGTVASEVRKMLEWMEKVAFGVDHHYIQDYENHPHGWMCAKHKPAGKRAKGYIMPYCPWANICHGITEHVVITPDGDVVPAKDIE